MSSGEKAKPPATFEERNPFDISRRSGPEVAAEIAKRMAAWKQARTRTGPAPTASPSAASPSSTIPSGDAKLPPIAAPVQPPRMPKAGSQPSQAAAATVDAGKAAPRVPYFAVSATRRAMPPAPSLKQSRPSASGDERVARTGEPAVMPSVPEFTPQDQDKRTLQAADAAIFATPELPAAESRPAEPAAVEEAPLQPHPASAPAQEESAHPFGSVSAAEAPEPPPPERNDTERRRAEARALKARWIAAHDLDTLLERPAASAVADIAQSVEAAESASRDAAVVSARDTGTGKDVDAEEDLGRPTRASDAVGEPDTALDATAPVDEPALPTAPTAEPEAAAVQAGPMVAPDEAAGRNEPIFAAPKAPETASVADFDAAQEALDIAALDEMAGRREPTFDAAIARAAPATFDATLDAAREAGVEAPDEVAAPLRTAPVAAEALTTAPGHAADDQHALQIAALDAMAGRREPTFDPPVQPASDGAVVDAAAEAPTAPAAAKPAPTLSARVKPAHELPARDMAGLEEAHGRKEPTFDEPVRRPAAAQKAQIRLRPIETRIEARRVDTLRVDPPLTARRPIFPHIEPEEWDVPPMVAARASRQGRGTGWAIGLGSILLIAGITAPAAIWQQGRQGQDQVALVAPAPATQQTETTPGSAATGATTAQAPGQEAAAPESGDPQSEAAAPAVAAQQSSASAPTKNEQNAGHAPADPPPATTLGSIGNGEDVDEAPIVPPQSPTMDLTTASTGTPMARPFEPEQGNGPFLRAPTTGASTVPVAGAPVQAAAIGVKPNLMGQLKPKAAAMASASKPVAGKPMQRKPKPFFQQSPDQMFETLIETLSEGRPVNPATKPASPSSRR